MTLTLQAGTLQTIRKARVEDVPGIQKLITVFANRDEMLHRSLGEVYETLRDFFVSLDESGEIVGCAALHVVWHNLAEVKSLAVSEDRQSRGHGKALVRECLEEARGLGLETVFALTYRPEFFTHLGFRVVDKASLPHKVWNECIRCPKFPGCGEIAVVRDLRREAGVPLAMLNGSAT